MHRSALCHLLALTAASLALLTGAFATSAPASSQGGPVITFVDSGQRLGLGVTFDPKLGDIDADGDLDLFIPNYWTACKVWKNDGSGIYTLTSQGFGTTSGHGVDLGDLDGDGDLDAFLAFLEGSCWVLFNDGTGIFTDSGQRLGAAADHQGYVSLADLDGDDDLDAAVLCYENPNRIWFNNGAGVFAAGPALGDSLSREMAVGDLDSDGDADIFMRVGLRGGTVWLNDGAAGFTDTGQSLGYTDSWGEIQLGDLDGDGDLDAFMTNQSYGSSVWLNDGAAGFSAGNAYPGGTEKVDLADIEGDGDLDAFTTNYQVTNRVWLNNGGATFTPVDSLFGAGAISIKARDIDADTDLDVVVGRLDGYGPTSVYFNTTPGAGAGHGETLLAKPLIWLCGPNPSGNAVEITYRVPTAGPVTLQLFDVLGREVRTLAKGSRQAGEYSFTIDKTGLAPGAYLCRLEARDGTARVARALKVLIAP